MKLKIITPERAVLESNDIQHLLLPAENGEVGILPGHIAMVCSMQVGRIRAEGAGGAVVLATSGGYAEVLADSITVLAETAERAEEIDVARATEARDRAHQRLRRRDDPNLNVARARTALARAINRLRIASGE